MMEEEEGLRPGGAATASRAAGARAAQVYGLAGALGAELQRLSGRVGPGAVAGLVAQVVRLLELLEAALAGTPPPDEEPPPGDEAAAAAAAAAAPPGPPLPPGGGKGQAAAAPPQEQEEPPPPPSPLEEAPEGGHRHRHHRPRGLEGCLAEEAREENQRLMAQLAGSQAQEDSAWRKEREVMLRLKEVVDKQRDEIRAQTQEILCKTRDTEAEQLNRFMAMNEELRRKLAVVQAQLKSALQKKDEAERALLEARQEARRSAAPRGPVEPSEAGPWVEGASGSSESPPSRAHEGSPFPQEELRQILTERNELKTSLFLVQEELAYYQRELLNDERIPGILLDAVRSTIKKQRKKIRAKMLGTAEEPVSSEEEEEEGAWLAAPLGATVCPDSRLPESRIKSFFSQWYRRSSKSSPTDSGSAGAWEIVDPEDVGLEEEEGRPSCSSSPPRGTLPSP
uniref:Rab-interacting lysosomal protein isoform X3 n=1 Tax=Pogona vitticeps TaxID=103695 RepID=A0ABM5ENU8_9SAUR